MMYRTSLCPRSVALVAAVAAVLCSSEDGASRSRLRGASSDRQDLAHVKKNDTKIATNVSSKALQQSDWKCIWDGWNRGSHGVDIRVVAPVWSGSSLSDLYAFVDSVKNTGGNVIGINAVYDDAGTGAFGGLTIWDMSNPNQVFGDIVEERWANFEKFIEYAHGECMRVISWWNPSYVLQSSGYYLNDQGPDGDTIFNWLHEGESDPSGFTCGADNHPKDGQNCDDGRGNLCTIKWKDGAEKAEDVNYEPDLELITCISGSSKFSWCPWVYDPERGACYQSVWANQPSATFNNDDWLNADEWGVLPSMGKFLTAGLDGFILDAPNMYLDVGTDGGLLWDRMIQNLRTYWPDALILGEEYSTTDPVYLPRWQGIDGGITAWEESSLDNPLFDAINANDVSKVDGDDWKRAYIGQDAALNQCYLSVSRSEEDHCPMAWLRFAPFADEQWYAGNALARAMAAAGGYITVIENLVSNDGCWWGTCDWPGADESNSVEFIKWLHSEADIGAFSPLSLRAPAISNGFTDDPVYAMVKYDAFSSGLVAIFAANLGYEDASYDAAYAVDKKLAGLLGITVGDQPMQFQPFEFHWTGDLKALPLWKNNDYGNPGNTHCLDGTGSPDGKQYFISEMGKPEMTLGSCLLKCLGDAEIVDGCVGVNVYWNQADYPCGVTNPDDAGIPCQGGPYNTPDLVAGCFGLVGDRNAWTCHSQSDDGSTAGWTVLTFA